MYDMNIFGTLIIRNFQLQNTFFSNRLAIPNKYRKRPMRVESSPFRLPDFPGCYGTQRYRIFFLRKFNEIAVSIFKQSGENFRQMEQCNFSTSKIDWEERFPFVGKTGENLPPNMEQYFTTDRSRNHPFTVAVN